MPECVYIRIGSRTNPDMELLRSSSQGEYFNYLKQPVYTCYEILGSFVICIPLSKYQDFIRKT